VYEPFWRACEAGQLVFPHCSACGRYLPYARSVCSQCGRETLSWLPVSGRGRVYSYTVIHRAPHPEFRPYVPYVLALIELDEGVRMVSWVVDCRVEEVRVEMPVRVVFRQIAHRAAVPCFAPVHG
jgi:uncharacterized OB-fold protein